MSDHTDVIEWYVQCLKDVIDRKVVRGLGEAEAGYLAALPALVQAEHERDALERDCDRQVEARETAEEALADARSGYRYIEQRYGRLDGVGWDRVLP